MAALNRAWSLRCQVRSAGAGSVVEGLALAVIVRGGVSFPADGTSRLSRQPPGVPARSSPNREPGEHHEIVTSARYRGKGCPGAPVYRAAACRTRSFSLLTRHDDMSLCIVRFRDRRGSRSE